ncbi:MAG: helix-turn-helix domain-containing protein, partial [Clostridia bacterium]|nr:helix-turn-helix domain-containing protein [Clostridia bacterium]
ILNNKEIYEKVDKLRLKKGWTIYELAKKSGISPQTIYNWRNKLSSPSLSLLDAVCYAFGITVIDFLLDEEELINVTNDQKELVRLWNTLSAEQKKSFMNIMKSMK